MPRLPCCSLPVRKPTKDMDRVFSFSGGGSAFSVSARSGCRDSYCCRRVVQSALPILARRTRIGAGPVAIQQCPEGNGREARLSRARSSRVRSQSRPPLRGSAAPHSGCPDHHGGTPPATPVVAIATTSTRAVVRHHPDCPGQRDTPPPSAVQPGLPLRSCRGLAS